MSEILTFAEWFQAEALGRFEKHGSAARLAEVAWDFNDKQKATAERERWHPLADIIERTLRCVGVCIICGADGNRMPTFEHNDGCAYAAAIENAGYFWQHDDGEMEIILEQRIIKRLFGEEADDE